MMKNRITAILVSVFILLNTCVIFAATENSTATDYQQYTEAAETLAALGFAQSYSGDDLVNKRMSRGEFTDIVIRMLNQDTVWTNTQVFTDVEEGHSYANAVNTAYSLGLISGVDGSFRPDDPITFEQAAKILVLALGYRLQAEKLGGYPEGYLALAGRLDITKGVSVPKNMLLRNGMALQMAFNCLEVDVVEMQISTSKEWEISVAEGATILSEYHNIKKGRGVVNKTPVSSLSSATRSAEGTVEINEKLYQTGDTAAEDFLGYRVTWYCDSEGTLLHTYCDMRYNDVESVDIADIIPGSFNSDGEKFSYTDKDGKTQQINVSHYADYLYNGVSTGSFKPELLTGEGYVTFIDNDTDKASDVVMIWSYEVMVADSIDKATQKVFVKYGDNQMLDIEENSKRTVKIIMEDKKVNLAAIGNMDILSVFKSLTVNGYEHIEIVISRDSINGKIEWITDENKVGIGENEYTLSAQIAEESDAIMLGSAGKFYIDAYGKIVHFEEDDVDEFKYGYIIAAGLEGTINKKLQLKLLTINSEIDIFDCDENIVIDGFRPKSGDDAIVQLTAQNGKCAQVVRYKMNEQNIVTAIDTVESGPKAGVKIASGYGIKAEDEDSLRLDLPMTSGSDNARRWIYGSSTFGVTDAEVILNGNITRVLILPRAGVDSEEIYRFTTRGYFTSGQYYHIACYNMSEYKVADLVITYEGEPAISEKAHMAMVDKVTKTLNNDGEWVEKVRMIYNGSVSERFTIREGIADGLKQGDMITFAANNLTEIVAVEKKNYGEGTSFGLTSLGSYAGYFYADMNIYHGVLLGKEGNEFLISMSSDLEDKTMQVSFSLSSTKSILYSKAEKTVSVISNAELVNYTYSRNPDAKVIVACYGGRPSEIFIMDYSE